MLYVGRFPFVTLNPHPTHPPLFLGESRSEGGFKPNQVSSAALLDAEEATDKKGHKYYK